MSNPRSAAQVLVDQLLIHGTNTVFCVPGESYLPVLDALYQPSQSGQVRLIACRQEGGAAFMAEAHGKLTGQPGICFVTRGPGACNAAIGVHTAFHDSSPMVLFIGQIARHFGEREAFQEIDFRRLFGPISKWATQIDDPARIPELIARAYQLALSGRPGPVVIALPEDMLEETVAVADAVPARRVQAHPGQENLATLQEMLGAAERPLMIVGGGDWSASAAHDIRAFAQANNLPVAASFRAQDIIDNRRSAQYVGALGVGSNPALSERIAAADLLLVVGDRLSEMVTDDYRLLNVPRPQQTLVHVFPEPSELGRVYQPHLAILSGMAEFAVAARSFTPLDGKRWADWTRQARGEYEKFLHHGPMPGALDLGAVFAHLRERLPHDAIITNGAGNYTAWCHRFLQFSAYRSQVAPVNGTMGYGVPAAVAAKALQPQRTVVAFAGDGCFLMNGQELATAMQYGLHIVVIVINNGMYGTIRMHQEQRYPERVIGTGLVNPDFAQFAQAFGAHGEVVTQTADFAPALERALASRVPALLELRVDPDAILPRTTLSAIRAAHSQPR